VGKTAGELRLALRAGILLFNVESEAELELLAECAARQKKTASVALRVNPDVPAETHPYISTGLREHKFGVPMEEARPLYRRAASHKFLKVAGISLHIGSQITDISPFGLAVERSAELIRQLTDDGHSIRFLDAGGGLGISYASASPVDLAAQVRGYAETIQAPLRTLGKPRPHLLLEPGRSIIAPAGALLTRVLYTKHNGKKRFTIVDAAMNDLFRPALYGARHEVTPVLRSANVESPTDVVGPVCETADFLARDASLPFAAPGDLLCVLDAGAYGMSLSSNYNTRPRAAELLVEGSKVRLIRRRETLKDLLRPESACL
jgi:diaminopimelate decarboxylase